MGINGGERSSGESVFSAQDLGLALDGCWKRFGDKVALQPTSLRVARGAAVLISGANAAGKTTLLQMAAGSLRPSGGTSWRGGRGLYLATGDGGRAVQTVFSAVTSAARLVGATAHEALDVAGCKPFADRKVAEISRGQRARLTLAVAVAVSPRVLCLDEPAAHLDDEGEGTFGQVMDVLRARNISVVVAAVGAEATMAQTLRDRVDASLRLVDGSLEPAG